MTTKELLESGNRDFLAACETWQQQGRAVLFFADWFLDRYMDAAGEAWRWFANGPERYTSFPKEYGGMSSGGPYPFRGSQGFVWWTDDTEFRASLPLRSPFVWHDTFAAAIAWGIDAIAEVNNPVPAA